MKTVTKGTVIVILGNVFACLVMPTNMIVQSVDVSTMCIFWWQVESRLLVISKSCVFICWVKAKAYLVISILLLFLLFVLCSSTLIWVLYASRPPVLFFYPKLTYVRNLRVSQASSGFLSVPQCSLEFLRVTQGSLGFLVVYELIVFPILF